MTSSYDDRSDFRDIQGKKKIHNIRLIPVLKDAEQQPNLVTEGDDTSLHADFTMPVKPKVRVDEISTEVNLLAIGESSHFPHFDNLEHLPFDLLETGRIPAMQATAGDIKHETQGSGEEGYASLIRNLVKSSGIYAMTSLVSPLISLVLAPFLTRNLSHSAYGALTVLSTAITLLAALTQLGLNAAFFRSYNYDYESQKDRLGVLSTVVLLLTVTSFSTALVIILTAPGLSTFLFGNTSFSAAVRAAALVLLVQNLAVPGLAWLRAENRALFFALLSTANLLLTLGSTIVLVGMLQLGIAGSLIASAIGYALVGICTLPVILLRAGLRLRFDIARGLLSFGLPMVFSIVSVWVLQLSDRLLLSRLGSLTQTASYSVAYTLGGAVSVVVLAPFTLAWPSALFTIARKDDALRIFQIVFRWFSMILLFAAFALSFVSTVALYWLFPPAYHSAAPVIPIIVLSTVFYGIYNIFTTGISIQRKTWFLVIFTSVSALVNVGLNLILIPLYGLMGAAMSTLLAYMLLAFIAYVINQRLYPIPYEIGIFVIELLLGIVFYVGSSMLAPEQGTYKAWGILLGALALYGGYLLLTGRWLLNSRKNV